MTPHTNQVVPVEPNYEDFEELITSELFKSFDHSEWKGQIKAFWCVYQEAFEKGAIAAAPQQQGEPVYQVCGIHDGHQSPWSEVTKATYDAYIESDSIKKRILYTQPLTADASFNALAEFIALPEKHTVPDGVDRGGEERFQNVFKVAQELSELAEKYKPLLSGKLPTDMVTMTPLWNDEELQALLRFCETTEDEATYDVPSEMMKRLARIGLVRWVNRDIYQITEFGDFVSRALEGK